MKNFSLSLLFVFCFFSFSFSQNLVPDPSFEDTLDCATYFHSPNVAFPWFNPTISTPDYYSIYPNCGTSSISNPTGYQLPLNGNAYCGVYVYNNGDMTRDYIEVKLLSPLMAEKKYYVSFYTSLANESEYAVDRLGAFLSPDSVIDFAHYDTLNVIPQIENPTGNIITDTINWVKISGIYTATGNEKFIVIGNFFDNSQMNVSIINAGSVLLNSSYYYIDSITLQEIPTGIYETKLSESVNVFPNPTTGNFKIDCQVNEPFSLRIFNAVGEIVFQERGVHKSEYYLSSGIYFLELNFKKTTVHKKIIIY